jgi:transcriptional regulator with XRE-family HTH domain
MKNTWDNYVKQQLKNPTVRQAYDEEKKVLSIGLQLANQRRLKGMTQAQVAHKIGTSTPQLSRTERRPERVNMRTLMRYASAVGMDLDVRLVHRKVSATAVPAKRVMSAAAKASARKRSAKA